MVRKKQTTSNVYIQVSCYNSSHFCKMLKKKRTKLIRDSWFHLHAWSEGYGKQWLDAELIDLIKLVSAIHIMVTLTDLCKNSKHQARTNRFPSPIFSQATRNRENGNRMNNHQKKHKISYEKYTTTWSYWTATWSFAFQIIILSFLSTSLLTFVIFYRNRYSCNITADGSQPVP